MIAKDACKYFPDSQVVNKALCSLIDLIPGEKKEGSLTVKP
jgi:hypothetical protein